MLKKVILDPSASGSFGLRIDDAPTEVNAPTDPERELHLGSQDLLRLADFAQKQNFKLISFLIADPYLVPLSTEEQDEVSEELIEMFQTYGLREVEAALQNEYDGFYIVGINLLSISSGMRLSVRRRGYIQTQTIQETKNLIASAVQKLELT